MRAASPAFAVTMAATCSVCAGNSACALISSGFWQAMGPLDAATSLAEATISAALARIGARSFLSFAGCQVAIMSMW